MATPKIIADFETQLATAIAIGGTSFTLSSATDDDGVAIPAGTYYFTVDNGSSAKEYLMGTVAGTAVTGVYSVSRQGVETSGAVRAHRVGASVIITDFATYKKYMDGIALVSAPDADASTKGVVQQATQAQVDAGTATGSTSANLYVNPATLRAKAYHDYAADAGGTDAYAITITPAITAYATGQVFTFKANTANTGPATLAVSGLAAKDIKKQVTVALNTGDILAGQIVTVVYDGTNMQLVAPPAPIAPTVQTFVTASTTLGSVTSRFDITDQGSSVFRYTWDGTGTDPGITTATVPTGMVVLIENSTMSNANLGSFVVVASGTNYFDVTNASGVAENDKALTGGYLKTVTAQNYTKPAGLKYAVVEAQGAGACGEPASTNHAGTSGGGGGAYVRKIIAAASIGATETVYVGPGGATSAASATWGIGAGSMTKFGSLLTALGGGLRTGSNVNGGVASGGDVNIDGGPGGTVTLANVPGGDGGNAFLGNGGPGAGVDNSAQAGTGYGGGGSGLCGDNTNGAANGADGAPGILIVTEYYN